MASSYFFNGRLYVTPSVMSVVNDTAMAPTSLTVGNVLCIIGDSAGGKPLTALPFGDPGSALAALQSGALCDAVVRAFAPSSQTQSPATVIAVRVGQATQATLILLDGSASPVIDLTTDQYGLSANLTSVKVAAGSTTGKAITIQNGADYYTQDNITRTAFTIQYAGAGSTATMSVSNTQVVLTVTGTGATSVTIALSSYPTVGQLVAYINAQAGFAATITDGQGGVTPSLQGLDTVSPATDVKTALYSCKADLQACIDWINSASEGFVTAVRHTSAGTVPAVLAKTYMSGGTSPAPVTQDWTDALTMLQTQDVNWIVPMSGDAAVHAAVDAHVQYMSTAGRRERRAVVGPARATTVSAVKLLPIALNSDRTMMVYPGYYAYNAQGIRTLYDPFYTAALVAAGFAGMNPGDAMTNKAIAINGLELSLANPTDTDSLIQLGVCPVVQEPSGFKVVRSVSTWTVNNNYNRVEMSCGAATDFVARNVRAALQPLLGGRQDPLTLGRAYTVTEGALIQLSVPEPAGPGVIVGDANSPAYKNIRVQIQGDVLLVSFQCSPVIPTNFIPVTITVVPYAGVTTSSSAGAAVTV